MIPRIGMKDSTAFTEHIHQKLFVFMEVKPHSSNEARWSTISKFRNLERSIGTCHEEVEQIERAGKRSDLGSLKTIRDITYGKVSATQTFETRSSQLTYR
jgi:hypothetical protein